MTSNAQVFRAIGLSKEPQGPVGLAGRCARVCAICTAGLRFPKEANERYLDAFATLDDTTRMAELIRPLQQSCQYRNRRVRALRPFADDYLYSKWSIAENSSSTACATEIYNCPLACESNRSPSLDLKEKRRRSAA